MLIPSELIQVKQWLCWRFEIRNGKRTKVPIDPLTGKRASSTNPISWADFDTALKAVNERRLDGIGFVFTENDPYTGVDLDDCRNPQTGELAVWAGEILNELNSYAEISPSETGIKIVLRGELPAKARNRTAHASGTIEIYSKGRCFALTGRHLQGTPKTVQERQSELLALYERIFGNGNAAQLGDDPRTALSAADLQLIDRARHAANGAKFERLWGGNWKGDYPSQSEADLALCSELAFWTEGDAPQIDRLFRHSGLYRKKWERGLPREDGSQGL